ncbi:Dfm1p [Kluyveromyces lactis]|uniref:Derlin n=1 Tax=Kluyveromyces lactis (strain ATCC 8585 / CBS 2359 / DSM 70799 / NBRC 1267 / NRRL Y-1140 / WM37) TaxID=284590 RepID=Q6CY96_KLULA|nr:uncharacterized protein KLLA0_A02101g [Kluyveromyces lactis]CAH02681.1 KLLA0A02101p [Kluyveromyces lactis]|eukprot:XP_451093.1 uncharacterized protein KLLA0_A02101g [Kluyveromyces lactis]
MTMRNELIQFVGQIPPVTRGICLLMVLICLIQRLNVLPYYFSDFKWSLRGVLFKFQIWRLFTSFLILPNDAMKACFDLYAVYSKSLHLELVHFSNKSIDYLFYICFNFALIVVLVEACQISYPVFTNAFIGMILYTWTLDNSNVKVMFYGLFPILGKYLSLVHLFVSFLFDDGTDGYSRFCVTMVGFCAGYVYSCLDTWTYGPLYGYLMGKDPAYGFSGRGHFRSPRWFSSIILWIGRVLSITSKPVSSSNRTDPVTRRRLRTPLKKSTFAGTGNRLGTKID